MLTVSGCGDAPILGGPTILKRTLFCLSLCWVGHVCLPILGAPTGVTLTLLNGTLLVEGYQVATGVQVNNLPGYVTVAKASTTIVYQRVGRSMNANSSTGWAFFVKSKHGDYYAAANPTEVVTDSEKILHLV